MLMIECQGCKEWIRSPFLLEMKELTCPNCAWEMPVKEIYVSAGAYSIFRDALLKSLSRYRHLLSEAENELQELKDHGKEPTDKSTRALQQFIRNLKELLDGCRPSPRAPGGNALLKYTIHDVEHKGGLVNLSTSGICIAVGDKSALPRKGDRVSLFFGGADALSARGEVIWAGRNKHVGIKFVDLDESALNRLHNYILEKIPDVTMEKRQP